MTDQDEGATAQRPAFIIRSEADAWQALRAAVADGGFPDDATLRFEGWPCFNLDAKGRDWHSTVPTRIMPPLLEVQRDIHRAFTLAEYGEFNLRRLGEGDRDALEVVVRVAPGSSLLSADLSAQLNRIAHAVFGRMNGAQATVSILGIALTIASPVMYKAWLQERQAEKQMDVQVKLSQQETQRLQLMSEAVRQRPELQTLKEETIDTSNKLLKATRPGDTMSLRGTAPVSAEQARELVQPDRERAKDIELHGLFRIIGNRTDKGAGFRITVRRDADGMQFAADVPKELAWDAQQAIQKAEWSKAPVELVIDAEKLHDKITRATVLSAKPVEAEVARR